MRNPKDDPHIGDHINSIALNNKLLDFPPQVDNISNSISEGVKTIIKFLTNKKAPGLDEIINSAHKTLNINTIQYLVNRINNILRQNISHRVEKSIVILLPKLDKPLGTARKLQT